jgi:hypothetical protein
MPSLRLIFLSFFTFLFVTGAVFWQRAVAVLLCGALAFNSGVCNSYFLRENNAYVAQAAQTDSPPELAKKIVDDFKKSTKESPWKTDWQGSDTAEVDRAVVAERLEKLIDTPELLNQGFLSLCGPAGFFYLWFKDDPVSATKFVTELYDNGDSKIGDYKVSAHRSFLLNFNDYSSLAKRQEKYFSTEPPSIIPTEPKYWFVDWMMLSALRNQANPYLPYTGDPTSVWNESRGGGTFLTEIKEWLQSAKLYDSVDVTTGDITQKDGSSNHKEDVVIIAVDPNLLYPDQFPPNSGHIIVPESPINASKNKVSFILWTWGKKFLGNFRKEDFKKYYQGAIVVKKKNNQRHSMDLTGTWRLNVGYFTHQGGRCVVLIPTGYPGAVKNSPVVITKDSSGYNIKINIPAKVYVSGNQFNFLEKFDQNGNTTEWKGTISRTLDPTSQKEITTISGTEICDGGQATLAFTLVKEEN